ncbi:MAG: hypothetical protein ABIB71_08875, partial [Candidatus Woesearchaeota archaeon]
METTKTKKDNKNAFQLKKLLGRKENQDLGDKSRWENIPVNYIVTANTLGIELNDYMVKRLNEAKDKELAFNSIYVANYFSEKARKLKKHELAKKLDAMVVDESIEPEDIAFYAIEAVKGELPKDRQLEKIAKSYMAARENSKKPIDSKTNTLDIVLMPMDNDGYCDVYLDYKLKSRKEKSLEEITINVYGMGERDEDTLKNLLNIASEKLHKSAGKGSLFEGLDGGDSFGMVLLLNVMLCGVCCGAGVGIGYFFGDAKIGLPIGAGLGIAAAESFLIGGTIY